MRQAAILLVTISIFFILATATSVEPEPFNVEYDCIVTHQGNDIIIISESTVDIASASLALVQDSVPGIAYFLNAYSLEGLATDTIPFSAFNSNDNTSFPNGEQPTRFLMEFTSRDTIFSKEQEF